MSQSIKKTLTSEIEIFSSQEDLPQDEKELVMQAREAMKTSYSPYSHFSVGAAVLLTDGTVVQGSNQENAAYGPTNCAERSALFAIGSMGKGDMVSKIAVIARPTDKLHETVPLEKEMPGSPCGVCRQVLKEYEDVVQKPITILMVANTDRIYKTEGIDSLLPLAFGPADLA